MEEWKVCPTWQRFEVSNLGNIRHTKTKLPKYKKLDKDWVLPSPSQD